MRSRSAGAADPALFRHLSPESGEIGEGRAHRPCENRARRGGGGQPGK